MPMRKADLEVARRHIQRHHRKRECSFCSSRKGFTVAEIVSPFMGNPTDAGSINIGPGSVPLVTLVCNACFHVEFFAWTPIMAEALRGG